MQRTILAKQHGKAGSSEGFSLLEALVATALAGYISLGIMSMMMFAVTAQDVSQEITDLTALAIDRLEFLNSLPFSDTALQAGGSLMINEEGYALDPVAGSPGVYLRWQITDNSFWLKRIEVMAADTDAHGTERQVVLETFRILAQ